MTSTDTLLPCPFCGGEDAEVHDLGDLSAPGAKVVECNCCEAFGPVSRVNAIAAWNRRTPPTPATEAPWEGVNVEVDGVEEEVDESLIDSVDLDNLSCFSQ